MRARGVLRLAGGVRHHVPAAVGEEAGGHRQHEPAQRDRRLERRAAAAAASADQKRPAATIASDRERPWRW